MRKILIFIFTLINIFLGTIFTAEIKEELSKIDQELITACEQSKIENMVEKVQNLLKLKANVNCMDDSGLTPIILATMNNTPEVVDILLENKADIVNVVEGQFSNVVNEAINSKNNGLVKKLLELKAPAQPNEFDFDPLQSAVFDNNIDGVKLLLNASADANLNLTDVGYTILALENKNSEILKELLYFGAKLNSLYRFKFISDQIVNTTYKLLKINRNIPILDLTSQMWMVLFNYKEYLERSDILQLQGNTQAGDTALSIAQKYDKKESAKLILDKILPVVELIRSEICIPLPLAKLIGHYLFGV